MAGFIYMTKTEKSHDYFTVLAWGTKKLMMEWAEKFDAAPDTIESKIVRESDKKVVHHYRR